ncbi:MAG: hypothetical protein K2F99_05570, partial [Muribaculaceae bacterium]|nr:hypothetical protein [Muribaculaceae bacterium]
SFFAGLIGLCIVDCRAAIMLYLTPMGITLIILALVYLDVIAERFEKTKRGQFVKHATKSDLVDLVALLLYKFDKRDGE